MKFHPENIYHIYNQGNNRQRIFRGKADYSIFLHEVRRCLLPHCHILAYCLMPNHFHFLVYTDDRSARVIQQGGLLIDPVTNGIRQLLSGYARIYNKKYRRTGSLFRQKTKAICLSDVPAVPADPLSFADYCANCFNYIHQNPYRAGLVEKMEDWEFSSFCDFAGLRKGTLCNKHLAGRFCSFIPDDFMYVSYAVIPEKYISIIRRSLRKG